MKFYITTALAEVEISEYVGYSGTFIPFSQNPVFAILGKVADEHFYGGNASFVHTPHRPLVCTALGRFAARRQDLFTSLA